MLINYKYKYRASRSAFFVEKIFSWRSTRSRSSCVLLGIRERRKSALRRSSLKHSQRLHLTGVKKVSYNLSLNLRTWRWTVLSLFFIFFSSYAQASQSLTFRARLRMCHVYAYAFLVLHFIILLLLLLSSSPFKKKKKTATNETLCRFVRLAFQSSALERDSAALTIREIRSAHSGISSSPNMQRTLQNLNFFFTTFLDAKSLEREKLRITNHLNFNLIGVLFNKFYYKILNKLYILLLNIYSTYMREESYKYYINSDIKILNTDLIFVYICI